MNNNKIITPLLLFTCIFLSGCPHRTMVSHTNDFYTKDNNMLCVNNSENVRKGVLNTLYSDNNATILLNRISPKKSCATFNINNKVTITSTDGNNIEMTPYRVYNFYTGLLIEDMKEGKGSGFGPRICFVRNEQNNFILNIENSSDRAKANNNFCPIEENID